ncbi:hypothetical protein BDN67DRAFT_985988 [Paxillus ammoniavirescens]|nr:hypothetical protein BDN67DRAFT_985988 [Paxillus ammoniavirescens]
MDLCLPCLWFRVQDGWNCVDETGQRVPLKGHKCPMRSSHVLLNNPPCPSCGMIRGRSPSPTQLLSHGAKCHKTSSVSFNTAAPPLLSGLPSLTGAFNLEEMQLLFDDTILPEAITPDISGALSLHWRPQPLCSSPQPLCSSPPLLRFSPPPLCLSPPPPHSSLSLLHSSSLPLSLDNPHPFSDVFGQLWTLQDLSSMGFGSLGSDSPVYGSPDCQEPLLPPEPSLVDDSFMQALLSAAALTSEPHTNSADAVEPTLVGVVDVNNEDNDEYEWEDEHGDSENKYEQDDTRRAKSFSSPESILAHNGKAKVYASPAMLEILGDNSTLMETLHSKVKACAQEQVRGEKDVIALNIQVSQAQEAVQNAEQQLSRQSQALKDAM